MTRLILPIYTILLREFILFYRQKSRIVGVLLQPILIWIFIGTGLNSISSPVASSNISYMEYFFPGIVLMVIMFTAIFSTIGLIEDRKHGFLQGVIIAPIPRSTITIGKILGGSLLGLAQGLLMLMLILTPLVPLTLTMTSFFLLLVYMLLVGFGLTGLGVLMAWTMDSVQGYHAIMSVILFPLWIFSGAVYPVAGTPGWLRGIMIANPMTHGLDLMRGCFYSASSIPHGAGSTMGSLLYLLVSCIVIFSVANWVVTKKR